MNPGYYRTQKEIEDALAKAKTMKEYDDILKMVQGEDHEYAHKRQYQHALDSRSWPEKLFSIPARPRGSDPVIKDYNKNPHDARLGKDYYGKPVEQDVRGLATKFYAKKRGYDTSTYEGMQKFVEDMEAGQLGTVDMYDRMPKDVKSFINDIAPQGKMTPEQKDTLIKYLMVVQNKQGLPQGQAYS
jgi:hypothetical protein